MPRNIRLLLATAALAALLCGRAGAYHDLHIKKNMYPKKEPDVFADTITRTSAPGAIPVLLIVRHANIFPARLEKVTITAEFEGGAPKKEKTIDYGLDLTGLWWSDVQFAEVPPDYRGAVTINVAFDMVFKGRKSLIRNNNMLKTKHLALNVMVGAPPLPRFDGWYYGDAHFHTFYSDNAVEFGAPLDVSVRMAERFGMDWMLFSDHSFDLDDVPGDSEKNDPALPRWKSMLADVAAAQKAHPAMALIPGEELSCGNGVGQNVHMLVFNPRRFYAGNGDGFEGANTPDTPCATVTAGLQTSEAAFAAHPVTELTPVETYVINRGNWADADAAAPGLTGLQAWNHYAAPEKGSVEMWEKMLLKGERKYIIAGTDSHGDFSMEYGNGSYPAMLEFPFGGIRTAVYAPGGALTLEKVIESLRAGRAVATSGPLAVIALANGAGDKAGSGGDIKGPQLKAAVKAVSSAEFGPVTEIKLLVGNLGAGSETVLAEFSQKDFPDAMNINVGADIPKDVNKGYVRAEAVSKLGDVTYYAFTNPVWFTQ